jgi:glycosyltransferase involved in cell wall biosynthesis
MSRKPNILHFVPTFHQGGSERQAVQLIGMLHETTRYNLRVACFRREGILLPQIERLGLPPVEEIALASFYHPAAAARLWRLASRLRAWEIDVFQTHDYSTTVFGMPAAAAASVPVRIAARRETDTYCRRLLRAIERRAFGLAHVVVVNADRIGADLRARGVPAGKIQTVHNGVDLSRFEGSPAALRDQIRASFGIASAHRHLVTIVANLWLPLKDHPTFLRAAARVAREVAGTAFVIAGEGALTGELKQLADQLGIARDVYFIGRCERIPELLAVSDVGVLTSLSEGFPNAVVEYMAAGLPVVATRVGGVPEAVDEGITGYLVPTRDHELMAARIAGLLRDEALRLSMGAAGRSKAISRFASAAQLARTEQLYDQQLRRAGVPRTPSLVMDTSDTKEARTQSA